MPNKPEIWKAIPATPGYEASTYGRIRSYWKRGEPLDLSKPPVIRCPMFSSSGNPCVSLKTEHGYFSEGLAGLILLTFKGNPPEEGLVPSHIDGDPQNNHLDNLCWETVSERLARIRAVSPPKEWTIESRARWEQGICAAYAAGDRVVDIARRFKTSTVYRILDKHNVPKRFPREG